MLDKSTVTSWLDVYVSAWKTYDPQAIGDLSEKATYYYTPFSEPVHGRSAIVAFWLEEPDEAGTYDGHYEPIAIKRKENSSLFSFLHACHNSSIGIVEASQLNI